MNYVDGFITPVPTDKKDAYRTHAQDVAKIFKEFGAISVVECWGDDVPEGKLTSFTMAVKREPSETVVFSWISWSSRAARDAAWEKVMTDPRMKQSASAMPFDGKRLIYGGFQTIVQL
jgi:uncharacterized protein YbaA (DUF1428 family)